MKKLFKNLAVFCIILVSIFIVTNFAFALDIGMDEAGNTGLSNGNGQSPQVFIINIVRFLLTFLGLVATVMILYGGFIWMTSQGNPERINMAKKTLIGAVIGLVIILFSFAIVTYILNSVVAGLGGGGACDPVTCGASGGICCPSGCYTGGPICPGGLPTPTPGGPTFEVVSAIPANGSTGIPRNAVIRFFFNQSVNSTTIDPSTFVVDDGGTPIPGTYNINGSIVEFTPSGTCPVSNPCGATNCFPASITVNATAIAPTGMPPAGGIFSIYPLPLDTNYTSSFAVSTEVDCQNPVIDIVSAPQMCVGTNNPVGFTARDDSGVSYITFSDNNSNLAFPGSVPSDVFCPGPGNCGTTPPGPDWSEPPVTMPVGPVSWNPTTPSYTPFTSYVIYAAGYDLDNNIATATEFFNLMPEHCCNGILDTAIAIPEEAIDCGGECLACAGAACGISLGDSCASNPGNCDDNRCASGYCDCGNYGAAFCASQGYTGGITDCCICQDRPIIDWVTPIGGFCSSTPDTWCGTDDTVCDALVPGDTCNITTPNGAPGNFITIGGRYFGNYVAGVSQVEISDGVNTFVAPFASTTNPACTDSWSNTQIIVEVPAGLTPGYGNIITVTSGSGFDDTTGSDGRGSVLDFVINSINRPSICLVSPDNGPMNTLVEYHGTNLDTNSNAKFGDYISFEYAFTPNFTGAPITYGEAYVPNIADMLTSTYVENPAGISGNALNFTKTSSTFSDLYITSFSGTTGPTGQYVTIQGGGFGMTQGTSMVYFGSIGGTQADFNFPSECADTVWSENQIIVKVPTIANGNYVLYMQVDVATTSTAGLAVPEYTVNSALPLAPSLCSIDPPMGPNDSQITLYGEYFKIFNAANSEVEFNLNQVVSGPISPLGIVSWNDAPTTNFIEVIVPTTAITGPVNITDLNNDTGNDINFEVGLCTNAPVPDDACGAANICCPAGTYEEGRCRPTMADCYTSVTSSVYEWDFNTGLGTTTLPGFPCDGDLIDPVCNASTTMCTAIDPSYVCNPSTCMCEVNADSCSGVSLNQCDNSLGCPNTAGFCSTYPGGVASTTVGYCANSDCDSFGACGPGGCTYNATINRCAAVGAPSCELGYPVLLPTGTFTNSYCEDGRIYVNTTGSCPFGGATTWSNIGGGRCIENGTTCNSCSAGFDCIFDGMAGVCAVNTPVCPNGSVCQSGECQTNDDANCECCCEIGQDARDCCSYEDPVGSGIYVPLTCGGVCGSDTVDDGFGWGECSGCALAPNPDEACNCTGSSGRFCDTSDPTYPEGVCRDCSQITDDASCSSHAACCIDGSTGSNFCRSVGTGSTMPFMGLNYCAYFNCEAPPSTLCDLPNPVISGGTYSNAVSCAAGCATTMTGLLGQECVSASSTGAAVGTCDASLCTGFNCLITVPPILMGTGSTPDPSEGCGLCCCSPGAGQCAVLDPDLYCAADQAPCSGPDRGLCCGCSDDNECTAAPTAPNQGCGEDACCHARPNVISTIPSDDVAGPGNGTICRNTEISATFNQNMEIASFDNNMLVVGDYGSAPCPEGTQYLVFKQDNPGIFVKTLNKIKSIVNKILSPIIPINSAQAYTFPSTASNYCAIKGKVSGTNSGASGEIIFTPEKVLDGDRLYYVIIVGDANLDSSGGVLSGWGIGLNAGLSSILPGPSTGVNTFNGRSFDNSYVWSFRTLPPQALNNGICVMDRVLIDPDYYLFNDLENDVQENDTNPLNVTYDTVDDIDKVFSATPVDANNQVISPIPGYSWTWSWSQSNPITTMTVVAGFPDRNFVEADSAITDDRTMLYADANITNTLGLPSPAVITGSSEVFIFECDNPWPPRDTSGNWAPWRDDVQGATCMGGPPCDNTNYEFYYCRDAGGFGTYDDLPAIMSEDTIVRGRSTMGTCSGGYYNGGNCDSTLAVDPCFNPPAGPDRECVNNRCMICTDASCSSHLTTNIGGSCEYKTDCNGSGDCAALLKEAYFFRESTGIVSGGGLSAVNNGAGEIAELAWPQTLTAAIDHYMLYYGTQSGTYTEQVEITPTLISSSADVNCWLAAPDIRCDVSNLVNDTEYYFNLTTEDDGTESERLGEVSAFVEDTIPPSVPTGLTAIPGDERVALEWNLVADAVDYEVNWTEDPAKAVFPYSFADPQRLNQNIDVMTFSELDNGSTYYFSIRAIDASNNYSGYSTPVSTTPSGIPLSIFVSGDVILNWDITASGGYVLYFETY